MKTVYDLTGIRYGMLEAVEQHGFDKYGRAVWLWRCDCGNEKEIQAYAVRCGHTRSCGCLVKENKKITTHGDYGTRLYKTWCSMKERCNNQNIRAYRWYGANGISVCEEWNDYVKFRDWAKASGYNNELTIERIDVNGNYCPENCTWITLKEQGRNKRNVVQFEIDGIIKPLLEWAEAFGVSQASAYARYKRGKYPFRENEMDASILEKRRLKGMVTIDDSMEPNKYLHSIKKVYTKEEREVTDMPYKSRDELRAYAKDSGIKLTEVAERMGVSSARLSNIMREQLSEMRSRIIEKHIKDILEEKVERKEWR